MGWNTIEPLTSHPLFEGLSMPARYYFLHSYCFLPKNESAILAKTEYGGNICSVVNYEHIYGMQCHPEKSHQNGITFLKNFGAL
jgi:glutamine amidotransferase